MWTSIGKSPLEQSQLDGWLCLLSRGTSIKIFHLVLFSFSFFFFFCSFDCPKLTISCEPKNRTRRVTHLGNNIRAGLCLHFDQSPDRIVCFLNADNIHIVRAFYFREMRSKPLVFWVPCIGRWKMWIDIERWCSLNRLYAYRGNGYLTNKLHHQAIFHEVERKKYIFWTGVNRN